jgi:acetyltransferase-like isoleucine patch superfamily enzyme
LIVVAYNLKESAARKAQRGNCKLDDDGRPVLTEKPRIPIRSVLLYGLWPGFIKILLYRLKGYRIGKGVSIGFGSVICGDQVEVGDHTSIGFLTIIRGKEIHLGPYVQIGSTTFLDTPYMDIGEGTKINEQVFVGGLQFPDSRFVVGRNCQIMQMSFINPAKSVVIGDDSGIGGHCLIFGHSSFQNHFEGYAVDFSPIEIGSGVGLAWRVFVLPGSKIGDGTMVGANSVVSGTLPPDSMAVGFPARVVGRPPVFPKQLSEQEKVEKFRTIMAEMVQFLIGSGLDCQKYGQEFEVRKPGAWFRPKRSWRMHLTDGDAREAAKTVASAKLDVFVSLLEIPGEVRDGLVSRNIMWIDIAKKEQSRISNDLGDEVSNYLKRYGVRTLRYPAYQDTVVPCSDPQSRTV